MRHASGQEVCSKCSVRPILCWVIQSGSTPAVRRCIEILHIYLVFLALLCCCHRSGNSIARHQAPFFQQDVPTLGVFFPTEATLVPPDGPCSLPSSPGLHVGLLRKLGSQPFQILLRPTAKQIIHMCHQSHLEPLVEIKAWEASTHRETNAHQSLTQLIQPSLRSITGPKQGLLRLPHNNPTDAFWIFCWQFDCTPVG